VVHRPRQADVDDVADVLRFPYPTGRVTRKSVPSRGAVDFHLAVMAGDDAVDDGEAQPGALLLRREEGIEDPGEVLRSIRPRVATLIVTVFVSGW